MSLSLEGIRVEIDKAVGTLRNYQAVTDHLCREMAAEVLEAVLGDIDEALAAGRIDMKTPPVPQVGGGVSMPLKPNVETGGQQQPAPAKVPPTGPASRQQGNQGQQERRVG